MVVPRILEVMYDKIIAKGKALKGIKKRIFFWSVNLGFRYKHNRENGWFYEFKLKIANKLVFSKWREGLGGNVKMAQGRNLRYHRVKDSGENKENCCVHHCYNR